MIFAVIPAAGHSRRMGCPKLSLPLGSRTVLEHVLLALHEGGVNESVVVIGPHVQQLTSLTLNCQSHAYVLKHETPDMRTTVEHGLNWIEERFQPTNQDAWLLVPADHPTLQTEVVQRLLEHRKRSSHGSIFVPSQNHRRGHPTLLSWEHVAGIRQHRSDEGINGYIRTQEVEVVEVEIADYDIFQDLDTPEDYEHICKQVGHFRRK